MGSGLEGVMGAKKCGAQIDVLDLELSNGLVNECMRKPKLLNAICVY